MRPTILFDLDDTLLVNDVETFLPAYLKALSEALAPILEPRRLIGALLAATQQMAANQRPDCTLKEVFEDHFYRATALDRTVFEPAVADFYAHVYPALRDLTQPQPGAVEVVEELLRRGFRLAVTTNPLFPRTAIVQRLEWAGLSPDRYPFEVVTSYETYHFAKPSPAFYAEVMAQMGWPEGPVITVGDKLDNDIVPSRQLGLHAFWIPSPGDASPPPADGLGPDASGTLTDLLAWLDRTPPEALVPDFNTPQGIVATLRSTPALLGTIRNQVDTNDWLFHPQAGEWSLTEIVCHMRDVETEVNLPRLKKVLAEDNPFLPGMDTDPWAEERVYVCQNGEEALHRFTVIRMKLLRMLESLSPEDWKRPARHAILSRTTLAELNSIAASHDRLHIRQAEELLEAAARQGDS